MATINPLGGPINYMALTPQVDIAQSFTQGLQAGSGFRDVQVREQALLQKEADRQTALQVQQQYVNDTQAAFQNPTPETFSQLMLKYPGQREAITAASSGIQKSQLDNDFFTGMQAYNALDAGNPDVAKSILDKQILAFENTGKPTERLKELRTNLDLDPKIVQGQLGFTLSAIDPDRFTKIAAERRTTQKEPIVMQGLTQGLVKTEAEIAKTIKETQNLSKRLAIDQDKLQFEVDKFQVEQKDKDSKLEPDARKIVNDSSINSIALRESSRGLLDLANKFDARGGGFGSFSKITEEIAKMTGRQDDFTRIRNEYTRIRNSEAIKALPPGVATDKDIQLALEGIPPATADAKFIASFLRGTAKLSQFQAAFEQSKADWVNETGFLGKAKRDIQIGDILVPKGTSYIEFGVANMKRLSEGVGQEVGQATVPTRGYMKYGKAQ